MIPTTLLLATLVNQLIPAARILPLPEVAGGGTGSGGQVIPLVCDAQKTLIVTVSVQGAPPQPFLLDTGASMTTIDERTAADLRLTGAGRIPSLAGSDRLVTAQLTVGPLTLPEGPVATMDFRRLARFLGDVAGILGSDALRAMGGATIDYARCTLTMGEAPVAPGPVSAMRVPLEWHEGRPVVSIAGGGRLVLDSGATMVTVFSGTAAAATLRWTNGAPSLVRIERIDGPRVGRVGRIDCLTIGGVELRNVPAVGVKSWYEVTDREAPDGLLPLGLFSRVHISPAGAYIVFFPPSH